MQKSIFKSIVGGLVLGSILYWAPFILIPIFIISIFMRMAFMGRMRKGFGPLMFDKIRNMSDEEYLQFKSQRNCRNFQNK